MSQFSHALLAIAATSPLLVAACSPETGPRAPTPTAEQAYPQSQGVGVVQAIDEASGTVTIAHEPIESLGWPAMTMPFKIARPNVLDGVTVGERIEFTLQGRDMSAVVTSIETAE
jgi:Cu(I)/Ag(I) efflux system periplasmic protein CusF